jgi:hypothetical protein
MRSKYLLALVGMAAAVALLAGTTGQRATAGAAATVSEVSAYGCISSGGHVTRPAGSNIVIRQALAEQTLGILQDLLGAQTTIVSVNDAQMFDVSADWSAPEKVDLGLPTLVWESVVKVPTGVTLANPGDQMRFTFAQVISSTAPEVFNPAIGGIPGQPTFNGTGLAFGGTCTVTAT